MPTGRFVTDLESGLPSDTGPGSGAAVGCADVSWSALRCTLAAAEEAARQLHLCVAWVSEESQRDFEAWNAAKKDDDLFGPLRPAFKQQRFHDSDSSAPPCAAAPAVQGEFSRVQQALTPDAQQRLDVHKAAAAVRRISLTDEADDSFIVASSVWEDFKCSPTQPRLGAVTDHDQRVVSVADAISQAGHKVHKGEVQAASPLKLSGLIHADGKAKQSLLSPHHHALASLRGRPTNIDIDDLKLGAVLGKGSFAVVYEGTWLGQVVAIKVLDGAAAASQKAMKEYTREMDMMAHLPAHPNILKLLGACTAPDKLILVMQHCSRGSLYQLLHSPSAYLNWHQLVGMCLATAQGMLHLHSHQALHRDLKSGNILLDSSGTVKVADFGLSRLQAATCGEPLTAELGTWQWMAPEVVAPWDKRGAVYTEKADVYSFGIVMWECAAREVPFKQYDGHQAAVMATYKGIRPDMPKDTPEQLSQLIKECWSPAYSQRPSFAEIVPRLQRLHDSLGVSQAMPHAGHGNSAGL
ncbi:hypothetical protein WJX77_012508 [Trebouxia sp. C0004]